MKRIFLAIIVIALFSQCGRHYRNWDVYFWTSNASENGFHLFINGRERGIVPLLSMAPSCNDDNSKRQTLNISLPSGKYRLELKDSNGRTKAAETFKIYYSRHDITISTTVDNGFTAPRSVSSGPCLIHEFR